ncbi:alpha-1,2-mannosidase, putative [Amycolatopsis marina]|uniref:Alpha-1,2-mannosidase, putative n=1 Tax=Amycolatopsis marina TaxID=490629 RepID=A0A1I1C057_9PSEU|nr:GH92 family glycosyl hydrolase [Amycolatopsis marina]SFB54298.1 alpha-1,2-mannosidase, putative [Amycolatopsis marina]
MSAGLATLPTTVAVAQEGGSFYSSFEAGEPEPTWVDTVETLPSGAQKSEGVNGTDATDVPGDVRGRVTEVTASDENTGGGEIAENLVDGAAESKWLAWEPTGWVEVTLSEPTTITRYGLTSANDAPGRDPQDWTLRGSTDGTTWTEIDSRTGESFGARFEAREFEVTETQPFTHYRLEITRNHGEPLLQLAELLLANDDPAPPPLPNMRSHEGGGPRSSYTGKPRAGYTGARALRYSGTHTTEGHGYSYNKVFDVDVPVSADTELSYKVLPEFITDDLAYPSTHVAVDLAFTDGSYLSDLGAADQYGFELSPRGQGAAKSLSVNQWNLVRSAIGTVAAGRTVDRILIGYDNPAGPGSLKGWFDDITLAAAAPAPDHARPSEHVLTTRGTQSNSTFSRGNNFPATAVPHGFNFWTPVTDASSTSWLYRFHEANNDDNRPSLQAFSVSHEPSPWMGDRQTFQVMPSAASGIPDADREARELPFGHDKETAQAHYYGVEFDNGLRTEIAPTDHAALFRFTFPGADSNLIFDNVNNNGGLTLDTENGTLTGYSDVRSGLSAGAGRLFVYATFDKPVEAGGELPGAGRDNVRGYLRFAAGESRTVTMRIATSLLSVEQARRNLELEIAQDATLESVRDAAQAQWDDTLGVIEVEGATPDQLTTLYSNLYRLFLYPNSGYENTGTATTPRYRYASPVAPRTGPDTPTETGAKVVDGEIYVNNGFWDTYRTTWPAYALFAPEQAGELIDGFVQQYRDGGWISRWSSPGYANLMVGTSSDVAFADAYLKGITDFDVQAAYDAALKNASVTPPDASVGRKGIDTSIFLGYTPTSTHEGMSWALEGYINDYGIANMSKRLYDESARDDPRRQEYLDNYEYFRSRAQNYVTMFDAESDFFQGRAADGSWRLPADKYDPRVWGHDYTETNGWNMAFTVPQDGKGLANLYGGEAELAGKLDQFFSTPETATFPGSYGGVIHEMREARDVRMGQYGHSNQPSHHIPYMYNFAGQPAKTQEKVREVLSRLYLGSELGQGYPGDEDNGEMSAWYIFSALGFYPLAVGSAQYAIGSPLFTKATVHLPGGKDLVINAPENNADNIYVQGLKVNGKTHTSTSLQHDVLAEGGVLDFDMGSEPSSWGTGEKDAPPSLTKGDAPPAPLRDVTGDGTATGSAGADVTTLFDNTTATETALPGDRPWVRYDLDRSDGRVTHYTLTSSDQQADPTSWVLSGSYDGERWTTVDERTEETFTWRNHTRAFGVERPGRFSHYRLEITGTSAGSAELAEIELLGTPDPACSRTVTGTHDGPLTIDAGVVCLDAATVRGPVTVTAGATLLSHGGSIDGPVTATGADSVVLDHTRVTGPVRIAGVTGETAVEAATVTGPVELTGNHAPLITATTLTGPLNCSGNEPAPSDHGLDNTVRGPVSGQCAVM